MLDKNKGETWSRVGFRLDNDVKNWFKMKSDKMGIPQSALMAMALQEYVDHKKAIDNSKELMELKQYLEKKLEEK